MQTTNKNNGVLAGRSFQQRIKEKIADKGSRLKLFRLLVINLLLFAVVYLAFVNFNNGKTEEMITSQTKLEAKDQPKSFEVKDSNRANITRTLRGNNSVSVKREQDIKVKPIFNVTPKLEVKQVSKQLIKNIYQVKSNNPQGFYIMVGSFANIENAESKQEENPTELACYIFYPKDNQHARVGLLVSEDDKNKALKVLNKVKKMQPDSWLLYNFIEQ